MRIALLEDDSVHVNFLIETLTAAGHDCHAFSHGRDLIHSLRRQSFDLLTLDWVVPGMSGEDVLRWVRENGPEPLPVIFITSRCRDSDIMSILNTGADDYVTKPVSTGVLLARVSALLRRTYKVDPAVTREVYGDFQFDRKSTQLLRKDVSVPLTAREFSLALFLFQNLGRPLSRAHISEGAWKQASDLPSRTLDTHVSIVRSKLGLRPENGYRLVNIYGYGYRLEQIEGTMKDVIHLPPARG